MMEEMIVLLIILIMWCFLITYFYLYHKLDPNMKHLFHNPMISGGSKYNNRSGKIYTKLKDKQSSKPTKPTSKQTKPATAANGSNSNTNNNQPLLWIPQKFPQVGVLTNNIIYNTPLSDFVVLEKTDGLHANIIIKYDHIYVIKFGQAEQLPTRLTESFEQQTILDTELYNDKYYIFDCPQIDGVDINNQPFTERMNKCHEWLERHISSLGDIFIIKQFENIDKDKLCELIKLINETNISPNTGNHIDGVIFQNVNLPYFYDKGHIVFKLKKPVLNTIDFKLVYDEHENIFYLYLIGTYKHVIYNKKRLPKYNPKSILHTGTDLSQKPYPKSLYVLFSSPYFENLYLFEPDLNYNRHLYFKDEQQTIDRLINDISANPKAYNNKIVEMSLSINSKLDTCWVPMRVRDDKKNSNNYDIGLSNVSVMFNPITINSINDKNNYFTKSKKLYFKESITTPYHDINKLIRLYIIEHTINKNIVGKHLSCLDLAGGRGADELALFNCGFDNIFAMDADKMALVQYVERSSYTPRIEFSFLLDNSVVRRSGDNIFINAIHGYLGSDNSEIEEDIRNRDEFPNSGFDTILMNYAIHYLCDDVENIVELARFVKSLIKPGGLFIFSCFDGDRIYDIIKAGDGVGKVGPFNITMTNEEKHIAHMPLPTIDSSGYRDEPLVLRSCLKPFDDMPEFKLVETFHPLEAVQQLEQYKDIPDTQNVSAFLNHIVVYVYKITN